MTITHQGEAIIMGKDSKLLAGIEEAVDAFRAAEKQCPANKFFLGEKPCPKCGAKRNESCRETVIAAYAVVDAAKAALHPRTTQEKPS